VSPAKTDVPTEMSFGRALAGTRGIVLDGGSVPPTGRDAFQGDIYCILGHACLAVDILKVTHQGQHTAMRPPRRYCVHLYLYTVDKLYVMHRQSHAVLVLAGATSL